ncbi:hypothetical protein M378DRAFT_126486 [Amanita muscaria Koide BX008]|uniref:Membrane insertase YidC/Oxa/ALB C-terminal domain-containing protein n=1 Tax=Amanita muscaria (strain Koide BX008) TaxID=946122 RepID=A0A0C2SN46_AMAMK|nr:hypothetical protein M378DRAFT_126486 [Amanita muscaria Koide BX008]
MLFGGSRLLLRSCRLSGSRLPIPCSPSRLQPFSCVSRPQGLLPKHDAYRIVLHTRSFTRTVPALSASQVSAPTTGAQASTDAGSAVTEEVMQATAEGASSTLSSSGLVESAISHLPPALQYGDFAAMGLTGWSPAGIIRWSFELINVSTGLPWFWTIVAGSLFWKLVLFPLSVAGLRNSAKLLPLQPQILKAQEEMKKIRESTDKLALQKHALKMRKMYQDAGVSMGLTALIPFVQIPVTLGMFFAVKKMCSLPVPQLLYSGLDVLPDLTIAGPYMILPIALCAAVNMQISVGAAELNLKERPEMGHIMNGLRVLSIFGVWVMNSFPSGLMVSLLVTSMATMLQSVVLQIPSIRRALDIPIVPKEHRGKLPSPAETVRYVIKSWKAKVVEAQTEARRRR